MSKEKRRVPKLRFPGFTEDWEQRKFGEIMTFLNGRAYKQDELLEDGKYKVLRVGNFYTNDSWYYSDLELDDKYYAMNGDLLYTWSATFGPHIWKGEKVIYHYHIWKLVLQDKIDKLFALQLLEVDKANIMSDKNGSTMVHITKQGMENKQTILPISLNEQKQIAKFLSSMDKLITLHQRKLNNLKLKKKALLQKLFPKNGKRYPELRFPGFTDAWEQRKLSDISTKVTTKNVDVHYMETLTNSAEQGIISQVDFFDKEISNKDNINGYYIVENNDFIYNPRISTLAPVGPINRNKLNRTGIMSPLYTVFRASNVDLGFLEWYFQSSYWHRYMKLNGDSGARADRIAIKDSTFFDMPIKTPVNIKEQVLIGEILEKFNQYITLHQRKLDHLQLQKKALLQQMFV